MCVKLKYSQGRKHEKIIYQIIPEEFQTDTAKKNENIKLFFRILRTNLKVIIIRSGLNKVFIQFLDILRKFQTFCNSLIINKLLQKCKNS